MIDTISSSFSVSAIAKPPSRGTMMPARNAPKIACTCSYTSELLPCMEKEETHAAGKVTRKSKEDKVGWKGAGTDLGLLCSNFLCGTYEIRGGVQVGTCTNRWYDKVSVWLVVFVSLSV